MKKRIAFISSMEGSPWGGSEELWFGTAKEFIKNNFQVHITVYNWNPVPEQIKSLKNLGAELNFMTGLGLFERIEKRIYESLQRKYLLKCEESLLKFKPDLVIISQGANIDGMTWMEFCIKNRLYFCTISQAASESFWPNDEVCLRLIASLKASVMNFYVSKGNLKLTNIQLGVNIENSEVVFNPFNSNYHEVLPYPEITQNYKWAMVARLEPHAKGHDILFEVLNDRKWKLRNLQINLFGKGTNGESLLRLKKLLALDNISFCGYAPTKEIWQKHHALILPSRFEGLPLSLVEAMMSGRFGIITDVSGNCEIVEDNKNAFVARAPKAEFLDEAMERAWQRKEEWATIGLEASKYIRSMVPENPVLTFYQKIFSLIK